jgi:hypothetical protein
MILGADFIRWRVWWRTLRQAQGDKTVGEVGTFMFTARSGEIALALSWSATLMSRDPYISDVLE